MAQYPDWEVGDIVTADLLDAMVPKLYSKGSGTSRTSTTTVADDPDLAGIPLSVGVWEIELFLFATNATAANNIKTQWGFTGTYGTPVRFCLGPGRSNTVATDISATSSYRAYGTTSDSTYGLGNSGQFSSIYERVHFANVTVAGTLSLKWAQDVSSANATTVQPGTIFRVRQVSS